MKTIVWVWTVLSVLPLCGCGEKIPQGKYTVEQMEGIPVVQKTDLPQSAGGMVLNIGSETITIDEILSLMPEGLIALARQSDYDGFRARAMSPVRQALSSRITDILLYQEARKKAPSNIDQSLDDAVEKETNRFVSAYGNNYALVESALKEQGMDWKKFRDYQRRLILTQSYLSSEFTEKRPVSHRQMLEYYNSVRQKQFCRPGSLQFRLIEINPAKLPADRILPDEAAETAAVRIALDLHKRLAAGEDFGLIAAEFSTGPLASDGGLWQPITMGTDSLAAPYDVIERHALLLAPGRLSGLIENQGRIFIIRLESRQDAECKKFEDVQNGIEQMMQFEFRKAQYEGLIGKLSARGDQLEIGRLVESCVWAGYQRWAGR